MNSFLLIYITSMKCIFIFKLLVRIKININFFLFNITVLTVGSQCYMWKQTKKE